MQNGRWSVHRNSLQQKELATRVYETSLAKCGRTSSAKTPHSLFTIPNTKSIVKNTKHNIYRIPNTKIPNPRSHFHKYKIHHHTRLPLTSVGVIALPNPIHHLPIHHLLFWPYFIIMNTIRGRWSFLLNHHIDIHHPPFLTIFRHYELVSEGVEVWTTFSIHRRCLLHPAVNLVVGGRQVSQSYFKVDIHSIRDFT